MFMLFVFAVLELNYVGKIVKRIKLVVVKTHKMIKTNKFIKKYPSILHHLKKDMDYLH